MKQIDWNQNWSFYPISAPDRVRTLTLPHDAMLEETRDAENPCGNSGAFFAGGSYHYEKKFLLDPDWQGKYLHLLFEGIYQTAVILVNGKLAAQVHYGYTETEVDITPYLTEGENSVEVLADNSNQPNSRWYSGAGIYRPVTLWVLEPDGLEVDGIQVKTLSTQPAQIQVTAKHGRGVVKVEIWKDGELITSGSEGILDIPDAKLWSEAHPDLYQCCVKLEENGQEFDCQMVNFGIRTLSWSPKGFFVNGEETLFRGGCIHHDNGILGARGQEEAEWRRVRIMKEAGFNALRISHNPSSRAMLEACDALGMYVMDETWDMWYNHKSKYDYADQFFACWQDDVKQLVKRDYNHPSVVMYSIGNEVSEPGSEKGLAVEREIVDLVHQLDDTRAVTGGFNLTIIYNATKGMLMYNEDGGVNQETANNMSGDSGDNEQKRPAMPMEMDSTMFNEIVQQVGVGMNHATDSDEADRAISPALDMLDVAGYNYASGRYPLEGKAHPDRVILGSETFPQQIYENWKMTKEFPYLVGDFMWTAWDYLGEAGIGCWSCNPKAMGFNKPYPFLLGGAGVINILGDPDGEALYAQIVWDENAPPRIAVRPVDQPQNMLIKSAWRGTNAIPAWSWMDYEGNQAIVEVYGRGVEAELFLNGTSVARQPMTEYKTIFDTVYQNGTLTAVVYDETGAEVGRDTLTSAVGAVGPVIRPESQPEAGKLLYVNIDLCGENGVIERGRNTKLSVQVSGGELLGFGSACSCTEESYLTGTFTTWLGRSQAIIRVGNGDELKITVSNGDAEFHCELPILY